MCLQHFHSTQKVYELKFALYKKFSGVWLVDQNSSTFLRSFTASSVVGEAVSSIASDDQTDGTCAGIFDQEILYDINNLAKLFCPELALTSSIFVR